MSFRIINTVLFLTLVFGVRPATAQLSPGELSQAHAYLEGLSNCTKCHVLGEKETTSKCLECHKEIQNLISQKKGYHASEEVNGKKCHECHGEHFGRDFKLIRFDEKNFDHKLTSYPLTGKHSEIKCADCHKPENIKSKISQKKGNSYLGLGTSCLSCHIDYHQNTLSADCALCHSQQAFRPAPGFNHSKTKFQLTGKHQTAECKKCHRIGERNGRPFQDFSGIAFGKCTNCHQDVHQNKFGDDCRKCHDEFSFHQVKSLETFNHDKTDFPLRGGHRLVDCLKCHPGSYTRPVKHSNCSDCHSDYHEKQFQKNGITPDCSACHSVERFSPSLFTIEKHKLTGFPLEGSHLATPCFGCHQSDKKWNFSKLGKGCIDCHANIHEKYLDKKYLPENNCRNCHAVSSWNEIQFDHNVTAFSLSGKHTRISCRKCHFPENVTGKVIQQFTWQEKGCINCHQDIHYGQFTVNSINDCERCHVFSSWKPEKFNHSSTRFKLDGKHEGLACIKCHKPNNKSGKGYVVYKIDDISCASCH